MAFSVFFYIFFATRDWFGPAFHAGSCACACACAKRAPGAFFRAHACVCRDIQRLFFVLFFTCLLVLIFLFSCGLCTDVLMSAEGKGGIGGRVFLYLSRISIE